MEPKGGAHKVLLADADPTFLDAVSQRFSEVEEFSIHVDRCSSGLEFLDRVYTHPYDLIFVETHLPDMNAREILSRLSQTTLPLPLVILASHNDARLAVDVMKRGVIDMIMKDDFVKLDLSGLLRRLLETFHLHRENAELHQINQMKNDFLATISHELRTPLTSILGLSELLVAGRLGGFSAPQAESLNKILEQSQHLVQLINQLLDVRAITHESVKIPMTPLSFNQLLTNKVDVVRELFDKKGVHLETTVTDAALVVMAHEEKLNKVLSHLISNALKFTPKQGHVKVSLREVDDQNVQLSVEDSGYGIPVESLPYVFQKFFHVDQTLTRPYGGMGLGLAYCKEVIESLNGRIWVESPGVDQGTTVSFILPKTTQPVAPRSKKKGSRQILWVDDNPNMLELVEFSFANHTPKDLQVTTAQGGVAALARLKNHMPDLVVLDIMMSDMDGIDVLKKLRADVNTRHIPVLIVSGYQEAARRAVEEGANDFCMKPFRFSDIVEKINVLLPSS